jgi:RHS repeat-associated protein
MDKHTASGNPVLALKLGYDAAGRLTDKFEVPHIGANVTLPVRAATYNLDNQIVSQTIGGVARTITSDADGNITSAPAPDGTSTLQTYGWNTRNQLTSAPGGLTYSYDAEGLRASTTQGGQTTTFVNDPHGPMSRVLWRIRPDGTRTFYIHGPVLLYEIEESASGGNPANAARFYHYDHLGSTIALSNDDGQPVARANYSAYGILIGSTGTLNTPFQWQGAFGVQTDPNGLHNMRARYYHCYMGRFISEDPIGLSGGPNTFTYANGNPISSNDPTGLWTWGGFFSVALDFVPVVGTIKSAVELATGYDYIAGESVNRGAAGVGLAASLIPGGKAVAKGGVQVLGTGAKHADEAVDLAKVVAREGEGVVYRRINPATGAEYVGQSIDSANYAIRQTRHDGRIGITHSYEVIATGRTKRDLDVLEEAYIRSEGGLLREGGLLENARHQMNPTRFVNETNSLLRQYQGTLLMQNGLLNGGTRSIK